MMGQPMPMHGYGASPMGMAGMPQQQHMPGGMPHPGGAWGQR